jgi:hypothetical protein
MYIVLLLWDRHTANEVELLHANGDLAALWGANACCTASLDQQLFEVSIKDTTLTL